MFPPHNLRGTSGRDLFGSLQTVYEENKERENVYYIDKTRYSAFAGTDLEIKLRERGITEVHLVGVCTDICVLHTAVDAYNKGFKSLFIRRQLLRLIKRGMNGHWGILNNHLVLWLNRFYNGKIVNM